MLQIVLIGLLAMCLIITFKLVAVKQNAQTYD